MEVNLKVVFIFAIMIVYPTTFVSHGGPSPTKSTKENLVPSEVWNLTYSLEFMNAEIEPEDCECHLNDTASNTYVCLCNETTGYMKSEDIVGSPVTYVYTFNSSYEGLLYIKVEESDVGDLSNVYCSITIGNEVLNSAITSTKVYTYNTSLTVTGYSAGAPTCWWEIRYSIYDFQTSTEVITEEKGSISSPADETGLLLYRPYYFGFYVINTKNPNSFIELDLTLLDLGFPYETIHDEYRKTNVSDGDFILIGSGEYPFLGKDEMFYGSIDQNLTIVIPSSVAHVMFLSTFHYQLDRKGYHIDYVAHIKENSTTPVPTTLQSTLPTPPSDADITTWVSLNGVYPEQDIESLIESFQSTVAEMVSIYAAEENVTFQEGEVKPNRIEVLEITSCDPVYCNEYCVSFYFRVNLHDQDGSWSLVAEDVDQIIRDSDLQYLWENISEDCTICEEDPELRWGIIVGASILVIAFVALSIFLFKKIHRQTFTDEKKLQYETHIRELVQDLKRKGSDKASILGEQVDSRHASLASRRFSMPVPDLRGSEAIGASFSYTVDGIEDFSTYDPEKGDETKQASTPFVIDKELISKGVFNVGFLDDESVMNLNMSAFVNEKRSVNFDTKPEKSLNQFVTTALIEDRHTSLDDNESASLIDQTGRTTKNPLTYGWNLDPGSEPSTKDFRTLNHETNPVIYDWNIDKADLAEPKKGVVHFASLQSSSDDDNTSRLSVESSEKNSRTQQRRGTQFVSSSELKEKFDEDDEESDSEESVASVVERRPNPVAENETQKASDGNCFDKEKKDDFSEQGFGGDAAEGGEKLKSVNFGSSADDFTNDDEGSREKNDKLQKRRGTKFVSSTQMQSLLEESDSDDSSAGNFVYEKRTEDMNDKSNEEKNNDDPAQYDNFKDSTSDSEENVQDDSSKINEEIGSSKVQFSTGPDFVHSDSHLEHNEDNLHNKSKLQQRRGTRFVPLSEIQKMNEEEEDEEEGEEEGEENRGKNDGKEKDEKEEKGSEKEDEDKIFRDELREAPESETDRESTHSKENDEEGQREDKFLPLDETYKRDTDPEDVRPSTSNEYKSPTDDEITLPGTDITTTQASTTDTKSASVSEEKMTIGEYLNAISERSESDADNWSRGYCSFDDDNVSERSLASTTDDTFL